MFRGLANYLDNTIIPSSIGVSFNSLLFLLGIFASLQPAHRQNLAGTFHHERAWTLSLHSQRPPWPIPSSLLTAHAASSSNIYSLTRHSTSWVAVRWTGVTLLSMMNRIVTCSKRVTVYKHLINEVQCTLVIILVTLPWVFLCHIDDLQNYCDKKLLTCTYNFFFSPFHSSVTPSGERLYARQLGHATGVRESARKDRVSAGWETIKCMRSSGFKLAKGESSRFYSIQSPLSFFLNSMSCQGLLSFVEGLSEARFPDLLDIYPLGSLWW